MNNRKLPQNWIELLQLLKEHDVEFIIIGAYALAFNGLPRYTGDLDILYKPTEENAEKLFRALKEFGNPVQGITAQALVEPDITLTFGRVPERIDFLNWLSGTDYADVDSDKVLGEIDGIPVWFISRRAYVKNKLASARTQDLADVSRVREMYPEENL